MAAPALPEPDTPEYMVELGNRIMEHSRLNTVTTRATAEVKDAGQLLVWIGESMIERREQRDAAT